MNASIATHAVAALGEEIWAWRRVQMPRTHDDIPRLARPAGWLPAVSAEDVDDARRTRSAFLRRCRAINTSTEPISVQIDHRLLASVLHRVTWELDVLRNWQRDPLFHVNQAIGPWFDLLLADVPFGAARQEDLARVLEAMPHAFSVARSNLDGHAVEGLARAAIDMIGDFRSNITVSLAELRLFVDAKVHARLLAAMPAAITSAEAFVAWLRGSMGSMPRQTAIGRNSFVWFLRNVALVPETPEELLAMARQEWVRSVAWETIEKNRNRSVADDPIPANAAEVCRREVAGEREVRAFYESEDLLTQPASLNEYIFKPVPPYLAPFQEFGVMDDLTDDDRLDQDGLSYFPAVTDSLPYFYAAFARDPRLGVSHEGAHYKQLAMSFGHSDPIRRRYYDSGPNEGIAFYNEELLLQAGLFDNVPRSREIVYNLARLRALRVEADVKLATGQFSFDEAVDMFVRRVPMDHLTAYNESAFYAANPGQALTYQIGKLQLMSFMVESMDAKGSAFSLRDFHDYVWLNGNMPFSLQRWEYAGNREALDRIDADPLTGAPPPTPGRTNDGREWVRRLNESENRHEPDAGLTHPDISVQENGHPVIASADEDVRINAAIYAAYPDYHRVIEHVMQDGDMIAYTWRMLGTPAPGGPATQPLDLAGSSFVQLEDGLGRHAWLFTTAGVLDDLIRDATGNT